MSRSEPFDVIDHTADVGIVAHGETLPELFTNAAAGMMHFMIPPEAVKPRTARPITVDADDLSGLLVAWLNELLVLLNADGFIPAAFDVQEVTERRLAAVVLGEPVDPSRHRFRRDVKAATYHQLDVRKNDEWSARVIFDV